MTDWFNIEAWGKLGDICEQYLHKGQLVYLEGRMKTDKYEHNGRDALFHQGGSVHDADARVSGNRGRRGNVSRTGGR